MSLVKIDHSRAQRCSEMEGSAATLWSFAKSITRTLLRWLDASLCHHCRDDGADAENALPAEAL
jgi:hypothetical protein